MTSQLLVERFKKFIEPCPTTGCWLWTGALGSHGYGQFHVGPARNGSITAPKMSYLLFVGEVPKNRSVLHHCDVRECVNPKHLYLGTHEKNMQDMASRGRSGVRGIKHPHSKLRDEDIPYIRNATGARGLVISLARKFGVTASVISEIRNGRAWQHIK